MSLRRIALAATLLLLAPAALGQTPPAGTAAGERDATGPPGAPAQGQDGAAPAPPAVDESALRYFAREGDLDRLEAEIRRLKTLYPSWEPPEDLFNPQAARPSDIQPIWDLYAAGRYAEAREAIARRRAANPSWQPPADLLASLVAAETRQRLVNASDSKQWDAVLAIAAEIPDELVCANIDMLWRIGEAFAGTGRIDRARDVYVYILQNCQGAEERLATMDKAASLLPAEMVTELFRYARPQPDGGDEFASVRLNLIRREVGAANEDPALAVPADDLARLEAAARETSTPDDPILIGFYYYRHGDPGAAVDWFDVALKRGGTAKAAEGYVLAMRALGRDREAEPVAYEWRDAGTDNLIAYITLMTALLAGDIVEKPVDQAMVDRFVPVVNEKRSALGAQALGWYAYNTGQPQTAYAWFTTSLRWEPSEVGVFGAGLTLLRLGERAAFNTFLAQWAPLFPRLPELFAQNQAQGRRRGAPQRPDIDGLARPAVVPQVPPSPGAPAAAMPALPMTVAPPAAPETAAAPAWTAPLDPAADRAVAAPVSGGACGAGGRIGAAAALTRGWCLMELNRPLEAAAAFEIALAAGPNTTAGRDAAYGKSLAYLRLGLTDQAALAAARAPQAEKRRSELGAEILTQRAVAAYGAGRCVETILALDERARIVPDTNDLMLLRAWSYYRLGQPEAAKQLFDAVERASPGSGGKTGTEALTGLFERKKS
jgi:tetratricopeptide (TPR) repeat protein